MPFVTNNNSYLTNIPLKDSKPEKLIRRLTSFTALSIFTLSLLAQIPDLSLISIGRDRGLSNSMATCITQDSIGYIWIGTQEGLNRFDGLDMKVYKHEYNNPNSLPHKNIRCLFTDIEGQVWVGTDKGLSVYDKNIDGFVNCILPETNPDQDLTKVEHIGQSTSDSIYFSMGEKLHRLNLKDYSSQQVLNLPRGEIHSFVFDSLGNIWIGSILDGGLYYYNSEGSLLKHYTTSEPKENSIGSNSIFDLALRGNNLWIATNGNGMNKMNLTTHEFTHYPVENHDEQYARYVYVDRDNHLWISDHTGIKIYVDEDDRFQGFYPDPNDVQSIRHNAHKIFQDVQGNYWVLYMPGGVGLSTIRKGFKVFSNNPNKTWHTQSSNISYVQEDYQGNLWLANPYNGIDVFYWIRNKIITFNHEENNPGSLGSGATFAIHRVNKGMYVGTNRGGMQYIDENLHISESYKHDPNNTQSIAGNDIRSICSDTKGNLWIAVHGNGIDKFDIIHKTFQHFNQQNSGLSNNWTFETLVDHEGNVWVASAYGLSVLPMGAEEFRTYYADLSSPFALSDNEIVTLHEDSLQRLWVGTTNGLNLYDLDNDYFVPVKGELRRQYICAILDDNQGNLWVSTLNGLYHYITETGKIRRFDEFDGLPSSEFNPRSRFKNTFNDLFFGSINGVILFDPQNLKYNTYKSTVIISGFKLFNRTIMPGDSTGFLTQHINTSDHIELQHSQNMITLEFKAISMVQPEKNQYVYKLEGFDNQWHAVGSRREVTFTNLDPGKYIFHVKAANNEGMWNEKSASLTIFVHPPWWGTWWFKTSCVLGIISLIIGFYLFRTEQLRKQKYTLQQEVKQRTTDLKMKNKLLEENTNYLNDSNALLLERQQKITEQRNQLEELNSMKDRLLSVIAHDLTSPFNTVLGFSEILQNEIDDLEHEEIQVMAGTIYESSRRVYGLLENLLNWARSQMHEIKFEPISVDLEKLIREIIEIYWFQIQKKKIHLSITNHAEHNPFADKNMLKAILRNLLSNAVKYTQKYGSISIRIDERGGNKIVISISDSGQGMDQYTIKHLFDLKESASKDGTEGEKGSGFGLILTQDFIHKNGGKLKVKSELGEGSSFIFDLPINL